MTGLESRAMDLSGGGETRGTLLLVDDEENILSALKRLLRRDGYTLLSASSGEAGLEILARQPVDVILSDQRMPGMSGVEFLRQARTLRPETVRLVLSGYTELQSVTSAINEGAIYKFLTKPWDDEQLRGNIAEAFQHKNLADENRRLSLELQRANQELAAANRRQQEMLDEQRRQLQRDEKALDVLHEVMQLLPWPLLGVDDDGMIAACNEAAEQMLAVPGLLLGEQLQTVLPPPLVALLQAEGPAPLSLVLDQRPYRVLVRRLGLSSLARGRLLVFLPEETSHG